MIVMILWIATMVIAQIILLVKRALRLLKFAMTSWIMIAMVLWIAKTVIAQMILLVKVPVFQLEKNANLIQIAAHSIVEVNADKGDQFTLYRC